eukprot:TRINITY_DN2899_c0_g1_i1.p1 TRINITY_DN2899_c0_g1~~TRINITY_DN2899_c0_g1_i1.p1  ORF type:complete len:278 (-),score=28.90 TRINITY_DN2899_c0_g1_i1:862-1695(-)
MKRSIELISSQMVLRPKIQRYRSVSTTVDPQEIAKFSKIASEWWNADGPMKALHHINPTRVKYIRDRILQATELDSHRSNAARPLEGLNILDLGCGAGILSESLARLGANVTGIDAALENTIVARTHAAYDPLLKDRLQYAHTTAEKLVEEGRTFDVVCSLEVVEHVSDVSGFVRSCSSLVKPGGKLFLSTLNRTWSSYLLSIVAAEYLLGIVKKGTHDWNKYLTPSELQYLVEHNSDGKVRVNNITGFNYNPLLQSSALTSDLSVNYLLSATKDAS